MNFEITATHFKILIIFLQHLSLVETSILNSLFHITQKFTRVAYVFDPQPCFSFLWYTEHFS